MSIDPKKIRIIDARPPEFTRTGPGILSPYTQLIMDLQPGQAFGVPTEGGATHKMEQRKFNARIRSVKRLHPEREFVTRTFSPGEKMDKDGRGQPVKVITLGIYRTK